MDNLQPTASPKLWTTLNEILEYSPCGTMPKRDGSLEGFLLLKQTLGPDYGDDTPITLIQILESNGPDDALWALRCGMDERFARRLVCDFAEHVLPICEAKYPGDNRPRNVIEVSRRFAEGPAWAAVWAALDAEVAAGAAAGAAEREWQAQRLRERYEEFTNV